MGLCLGCSLILEMDNNRVVEAINEGTENHRYWNLIKLIKQILTLNWRVVIRYTLKEGHKCADFLANLTVTIPVGEHMIDRPPKDLRPVPQAG